MKTCTRLFFVLLVTSSLVTFAQVNKPRIAVGGLRAESNSLYPRAQVMRESGQSESREEWMEEASKASTVASGVVEAVVPLRELRIEARPLGDELGLVVVG